MRIKRSPPVSAPPAPAARRALRLVRTAPIKVHEIVECPVDVDLVSEIIERVPRTPRLRRKDGYLHVSDLIGKCIRKFALADKFNTPVRPNRLTASDRIVFAIGDAIHDTVKMIATEGAPENVWGKWRCECGHLFHDEPCVQAETDPDDICPQCNTPTNVYREVPMFNDEYGIVGNPDLILYLEEVAAYHIVELKSIAHDAWKELARPLPEHVLQVLFYWFLMRELGYRLTDRVSVVYITKGYQFGMKSVQKEFMIDPLAELHRLDPYLQDALDFKHSGETGKYPARKECKSEYTTHAKKCEVCQLCFSLP